MKKTNLFKRALAVFISILMVATSIPFTAITASAADSGEKFLFAYFTGNGTAGTGANTQEIRFATSTDGISFTPLLNNNSAITQRGGTGNVRDPFIFKGHDGFYYIVGTDLNATTMGFWGNQPQIVFWKSADLITWTDETYINTAQICGLNNDQVQRTWAPEVLWDDALGKYMVYFAFAADGYNSTTMYYMTTSDLLDQSKYSKPQQLFAPGGDAIDADIVKQDGTYYMFYKDETEGRKNVCLATATSVTGPYTYQGVFGTSSQTGSIEGCEVFMIGSNYHLVADRYGDNGKFAIYNLGTDLSKLTGKATINMTDGNPVKTVNATTGYSNLSARHGSIVHISDAQYDALQNNAPHSVGQEVSVNGSGIASQIQSNLVAHYLISSGDQKPDFSGKNHNANTLDTTNTVWQNAGSASYSGVSNIQGLYFKLNNEHDYFKAPIGDMFSQTNLDQGITVSFMAKPDTGIDDEHSHFFEIISTSGNITWDGEGKTAHQYLAWFTSGNVEVVTSRRDLNGGSYANFGTRTAEKDAWHAYTLTLKRDEVKAYIDGELVGSTTANANAMLWNGLTGSDAVLRIGNTAWPDNDYKGYMRDFRIYNKALSEEEAAQMGATHKTFAQNQSTADAVAGIYAAQNNQLKGSVIPYANNTECYNGYANVLYSSNTWVDGNSGTKYQQVYDGTSNNYLKPAMLGMSDIVLLYDGKNDTAFPIIFKCQTNNKSGCTNRYRWDYLASEHADWTLAKNNQTLINAKDWNTFQTSSKEFSISTNTSNETNTGNNNNNKCTNEWPWQGACYFQGSFAENSYSKTYTDTISFKGQCDIRITWGISSNQWNSNMMYTDMRYGTSGNESKTVRVVNYKPIADKMDAVVAKFDAVRNAQNPNYGAAELKEYYEAVAVVTKNPNSFFTSSDFSTNISNYETWIKQALGTPMTRALAGPRAHSFAYTTISEATCTDAGLQKVTCSNTDCDYEKLETVAALGHIKASAETKANEVAATCEAGGSYDMQYLCTRCSSVLSSRTVNVDPTGHSFEGSYYLTYTTDSLADPDTTYQHYQKCANNEEHTNPTGCSWVPAPELNVEATAESQGKEYEKCSVCGGTRYTLTTYNAVKYNITFTMNAGYGEEARSQTIEVEEGQTPVAPFTLPNTKYTFDNDNEYSYSWPALAAATEDTEYVAVVTPKAHVYNDVVTPSTCGVAGYTTRTCTNDGCTHSYVTAPTPALEHSYGAWASDAAGHHKKVCLNDCGDVIQEDCVFTKTTVDPTCTADGYDLYTCETCGYSYKEMIDKLGHDIQTVFVKSTCTENGYYSVTCTRGDMANSDKYSMSAFEYKDYDPMSTAYINWSGSKNSGYEEKYTVNIGVPVDHIEITYTSYADFYAGFSANVVRWKLFDGDGNQVHQQALDCSNTKTFNGTISVPGNRFTVQAADFRSSETIKFTGIKVYPALPDGWTSADLTAKGHNVVQDARVEATCISTGLTAGSHCTRCDDMTVAQVTIPALEHSYTGEEVYTPANGDMNGYTGKRCVNGCNALGNIVYDTTDWAAYNAAVTVSNAYKADTKRYTTDSMSKYIAEVAKFTDGVTSGDETKSQAFIDRMTGGIQSAVSKLEIASYKVTFKVQYNGEIIEDETKEYTVPYGTVKQFTYTAGEGKYIVKWTAEDVKDDKRRESTIATTSDTASHAIYSDTTIIVYISDSVTEDEDTYSVTLIDKNENVIGLVTVPAESGYVLTKNGNSLSVVKGEDVTATLAAPKYPFYQVTDFVNAQTSVSVVDVTITEDITIKARYSAISEINITSDQDVTINKKSSAPYRAFFDEKIVAYAKDAKAWYADGELVCYGDTYTFQASTSVKLSYSTDSVSTTMSLSRIDFAHYDADSKAFRIVVSNCVPEGATIIKQGVKILTSSSTTATVASSKVIAGTKDYVATKTTGTGNQFMYTIGVNDKINTMAVVSYVTYEINGEQTTVWSSEGDTIATMVRK